MTSPDPKDLTARVQHLADLSRARQAREDAAQVAKESEDTDER